MMLLLVGDLQITEYLSLMLDYHKYPHNAWVLGRFKDSWHSRPPNLKAYDRILLTGCFRGRVLKALLSRVPPDKTTLYFVGTDAHTITQGLLSRAHRKIINHYAGHGASFLYVSEELKELAGYPGEVLPIPVNTALFKERPEVNRSIDVLYYLGNGSSVYRPDWIKTYTARNPGKKITLCGLNGAESPLGPVVTKPLKEMPELYNRHKQLIRMTSHDGAPKMIYEALLCGCKVTYNGEQVTEIPDKMRMEVTAPRLIEVLEAS